MQEEQTSPPKPAQKPSEPPALPHAAFPTTLVPDNPKRKGFVAPVFRSAIHVLVVIAVFDLWSSFDISGKLRACVRSDRTEADDESGTCRELDNKLRAALSKVFGEEIPWGPSAAVKWYQLAADQDLAEAQFALGMRYSKGEGIAKDDSLAAHWLQCAADKGMAEAQYYLAQLLLSGQGPDRRASAKVVDLYRQAAIKNFQIAQERLGACYAEGDGVDKDDEVALHWFEKAAVQGNASAQYRLGMYLSQGHPFPRDDDKAFYWFEKAAKQEHLDAQYNLALCYALGKGTTPNDRQAAKWLQKAADKGQPDAIKGLMRERAGSTQSPARKTLPRPTRE